MKTNRLKVNLLFGAILSLFFITCKKDSNTTSDSTTSTTTTTPTTKTPLDYEIDYSVNLIYTVSVVSGNHYAIGLGKSSPNYVEGATVSITQGERTFEKITNSNGMASFSGVFKGLVSVNVQKPGYTSLNYLVSANGSIVESNGKQLDLANIVSIFNKEDEASSGYIVGKLTYQGNLTNEARETVPENTKVVATIDADDIDFKTSYFNSSGVLIPSTSSNGKIVQFAYEAFFYDTTDANGNYSIKVPAGIAGLPFKISVPDLVADQDLYENTGVAGYNRKVTVRTIFSPTTSPSPVPLAGGATIDFITGSGASASASISGIGELESINVTNGGSNYSSAPKVIITGGGGSGATATATVNGGVVTAINLVTNGSGYTSEPSVSLISGSGASVSVTLGGGNSLKSIIVTNSGSGYTVTPIVTISAPTLPSGVQATAIANMSNGRVTSITITNPGSGYSSMPSITIDAAGSGGINATLQGVLSGQSVQTISIVNPGSGYTGAPTILISDPTSSGGVRATASAQIDNSTGQIIGLVILNPGSGYTTNPTVSVISGSGASGQAITKGRSLTGITILNQGVNYDFAPAVSITGGGGSGAQGTATVVNGRVTGVVITNPGTGYLFPPTINFLTGSGAQASVIISNGGISSVKMVNPGSNYFGAPSVVISPNPMAGPGGGASATAIYDASTKTITGVTITNPGSGFIGGNVPSVSEPFAITPSLISNKLVVKSGMTYIRDIYYGTGKRSE